MNPAANATTRQVEVLVSFRRWEAAAGRRRPVCRRACRDAQRRGAHSSRRIGGARGRQRLCVARQGRHAAEGEARRSASAMRAAAQFVRQRRSRGGRQRAALPELDPEGRTGSDGSPAARQQADA